MSSSSTILIAYDGSDNAAHAIAVAGEIFPGARAEILHAWEPMSSAAARSAVYAIGYDDSPAMLEREQAAADAVVARGVEVAQVNGLEATGHSRSGSGPIWQTIVDAVTESSPRVVIMGTRGLTGIRSALSGSVSHHVTCHSPRPVLTVPMTCESEHPDQPAAASADEA
jgi:nucleotide-binding universal stress UspA family protein